MAHDYIINIVGECEHSDGQFRQPFHVCGTSEPEPGRKFHTGGQAVINITQTAVQQKTAIINAAKVLVSDSGVPVAQNDTYTVWGAPS